jgi:hypothetical protein
MATVIRQTFFNITYYHFLYWYTMRKMYHHCAEQHEKIFYQRDTE